MRGLGIGIAVTALLMGIALSGRKETMTDEEIRQRALEMGMTDESGVLSEDLKDEDPEAEPEEMKDTESEAGELAVSENGTGESAGQKVETEKPEEETKSPEEAEENPDAEPDGKSDAEPAAVPENEGKSVIITINSGDGSRTVANKLKEAGLIEDAAAYDAFLCQNGYDKKIAAGNHEILSGASDEEIAIALTKRGH